MNYKPKVMKLTFTKRKELVDINEQEIFKSNGEFKLTRDLADLLDTVLFIVAVNVNSSIYEINLELRRCGFFISHPALVKILEKQARDGMISYNILENKISPN